MSQKHSAHEEDSIDFFIEVLFKDGKPDWELLWEIAEKADEIFSPAPLSSRAEAMEVVFNLWYKNQKNDV